ncbi:hypothetical protein [Devosia sp.]|nr:hypothetical protein [Devosia sp.]
MVSHLLDAPPRVVNDVPFTSNSPFYTDVTSAFAPGAPCPSGRE